MDLKLDVCDTLFRASSFRNTLSYNYAKIQANPLTFDTQNSCLGEIRYGEKDQKHFVLVRKPMGASLIVTLLPGGGGGGGGGGALRYRGGPHLRYVFRGRRGLFFKTSACPRFCKRTVLFCTQVRSMGVKITLQSTKYTRL